MADVYFRSRKQRYEIGRLVDEGKTLIDAENIVMSRDSNRSRQVGNWKEKGLYPYGSLDAPDGKNVAEYTPPTNTTTEPPRNKTTVVQAIDEDSLLERLINKLDDNTLLRIAAAKQGIALEELESIKPKLKKTGKGSYPASFRFNEELIKRVKEQLEKEGKGETLTGLIERLLFSYLGEPADMLDEDEILQYKIKLFLGRLDKKKGNI